MNRVPDYRYRPLFGCLLLLAIAFAAVLFFAAVIRWGLFS